MFEKHEIWDRSEDYIIIYVVFQDLETGLYHVQQADFLPRNASLKDIETAIASHNYYMADVFSMQLPPEQSPGFATVKEAVEAYRPQFADVGTVGQC